MTKVETCQEMVGEPPGFWHEHVCGRRAKFVVTGRWEQHQIHVCGTHVKWYQRWSSHPVELVTARKETT